MKTLSEEEAKVIIDLMIILICKDITEKSFNNVDYTIEKFIPKEKLMAMTQLCLAQSIINSIKLK